ncbi:MAG: RNA polymerase sigma factor [Deltaproteobacteria bacterium]|nr:RNA polymerase sigma factor [Deltaproteobacteria bacterium]
MGKTAKTEKRKPAPAEDLELAQAAAQGDEQARYALIKRLIGRIRSIVFYIAGGHADAEDWAQQSAVEILLSIKSFRAESTLEAWAERITVRTVMREIKRARKRDNPLTAEPIPLQSSGIDGEARLERRRISTRAADLVGRLKPKHREAIVLHLVLGYTSAEISEMTDTHVETVRYRLKAGRKHLRTLIEDDPMLVDWLGRREV